jgi:hypothetical protein
MSKRTGIIIQGFDLMDMVGNIHIKTKKHQATLLAKIEPLITDVQSPFYQSLRKIILDSTNDFTREIVRDIFGDVDV